MRAQNMGAELKILSELGKTEVIISLNI